MEDIFEILTLVFFTAAILFAGMWDTERSLRKMTRKMQESDFEQYLKLLEKYNKLINEDKA